MRMGLDVWLGTSTSIAAAILLAGTADAAPGQTAAAVADHYSEVTSCVDVSADSPRTPYGCFNVAHVTGLAFETPSVVWYLYRFDSGTAADAARSEHGMVVNEAGAFWLSELAPEGTAVRLATGVDGPWAWIAVDDAGPGIAPDDRDRVFERFWRGDARKARAEGRSGLGLAIVRQIVESHGGEVKLTTNPRGGSTFTLWLPASSAP